MVADGDRLILRLVVELDLAGLSFLDCAGIGTLVDDRNRLHRGGGDLTAHSATNGVAMVLDATGVGALLEAPRAAS